MMVRLYFAAGMPAAASRSIKPQMLSISRCRSGSCASRMCGLSCLSIGADDIGNCTMSSDEAKRFDMLAVALQIVEAPVVRVAGRVDADMGDAELGPDPIVGIVPRPDLRSHIHDSFLRLWRSHGYTPARHGGQR